MGHKGITWLGYDHMNAFSKLYKDEKIAHHIHTHHGNKDKE
jgi:hypothetical protein